MLLVALVVRPLGRAAAGSGRGRWLVTVEVGFLGALLGALFGPQLGAGDLFVLEVGDTRFPVVWSTIGAAAFVAIVGLLSRVRR